MAKKNVYTVTFTDGTTQEFTNKKAFKGLEGILLVQVNGEVTVDNSKEEAVMANTEVITSTEEIVDTAVIEAPAENTEMILFTASRGKNTKLAWNKVVVTPNDELVKVKGVAAELPKQAADIIGTDKFVAWVDKSVVEQFVNEGKPVRGMASTISDVFNRYCKVTETKGVDKVEMVLSIFTTIVNDIEVFKNEGAWVHPVAETAETAEETTEEGTETVEVEVA